MLILYVEVCNKSGALNYTCVARTKSVIDNSQANGLRKSLRCVGVSTLVHLHTRTFTGSEGQMYITAPVTGATVQKQNSVNKMRPFFCGILVAESGLEKIIH